MAHEGGEWKWRVIVENANGFEEILVKSLVVNVPSFSREDDIPWLAGNITWPVKGDFVSKMASGWCWQCL